jgi:hypothetical protein
MRVASAIALGEHLLKQKVIYEQASASGECRLRSSGTAEEPIVSSVGGFLIAFALIFAGALIGVGLRKALPEHHLADDTKDVVRLGTGLIGTIAALVLGLLIASANSSYQTQNGNVQRISADVILLDNLLAQYGPEAQPARELLRRAVGLMAERIWRENSSGSATQAPFRATAAGEEAFAKIQQLSPQSESQRLLKSRAIELALDVAQTRLLLLQQAGSSIPAPFLAVLIFWLSVIFASFGLFSRLTPVATGALFIAALSASGAIYLIVELGQPFSGFMQISSAPLRNALAPFDDWGISVTALRSQARDDPNIGSDA